MKNKQKIIFWDYKKVSKVKELERIAIFFPQTEKDKEIVIELYNHIDELNIPKEKKKVIEFYYKLIKEDKLK